MMHFVLRAMVALALISALSEAQGQPSDKVAGPKPDIKVGLLTGSSEAGEPHFTWIGVRVDLGPGWKTYWKSPGEAGFPTEFDWSGSSNVVSAQVNWPAPSRLSILGFETVGYTREVVFPVRIEVGDPAVETRIHLQLAVFACSTICVREEHVLAATIQPGASGRSQTTIDAWRSRVPQPTSNLLSVLSVERSPSGPASLTIEVASSKPLIAPDAFIESDPPLSGDKPVVTFGHGNRATLRVNMPGETAESIRTRTVTTTVVSDGASVLAVSPAPQPDGEAGVAGPVGRLPSEITGNLLALVGIALLGGFILNLMPCVFPVLSLKLLSFVHGSAADRDQVRKGFAASAAGILASFLLLASGLAAMKAAGASVGWGIQFQQPWFLGGMAVVLVLFAVNQFELLSLQVSSGLLTRVSGIAGGASTTSHFLSGLVATLLATPCSAPLVGTAVGFALSQGTAEILAIFTALGVGMASPYLLVAAVPAVANVIPRPGPWLAYVKQIFGVALVATAGWLLLVLGELTAGTLAVSIGATLGAGLAVLSLWKGNSPKMVAAATGTIGLVVAVVAIFMSQPQTPNRSDIPWRTFSRSDLRLLVENGRTVFVDVTADWCIACKINKALVINRKDIAGRLSSDVVPMRADWTRPDAEIARFMREHGRFGIPFNIVFGPNAPDGIALSEILSTSSLSTAFNNASSAPSNSAEIGHPMKKSIIVAAIASTLSLGAVIDLVTEARGESADAFKESVLRDPDIPSIGNPQGDVTIVEYFDYQCPYCRKVAPELLKIAKEDGKLRIVMKDWPIFGKASQYAAKMVLAAKYQNKYHEAHAALIGATTRLSEDIVHRLLAGAGVDVDLAKRDMEIYKPAIDALLARNNEQAEAFGFQGTPAFIIGTFRVPGVLDAAGFKQAIADARAAARKKK